MKNKKKRDSSNLGSTPSERVREREREPVKQRKIERVPETERGITLDDVL